MRKRNVKEELKIFPCFKFENGRLIEIPAPERWFGVELHHYITTQWQQKNPEKFEQVKHLQKLIFLPPQMHKELHLRHRRFFEKYGIEIKELLFNWSEYDMISAAQARKKSDENDLRILREEVEKLIKKAIEKGNYAVFKSGKLPQVLKDEIIEAGYNLEESPTGVRIIW